MFKLFKKQGFSVSAVVDGQLIPITAVKDDVFSEKMLGDGYAIKPKNGKICAPVAGTITTVFPTKHAIGITTKDNLEILLHLGLDTVNLKGKPFKVMVKEGDVVKQGDQLAEMDLEMITAAGYDNTIIVVYTNMDLIKSVSEVAPGNVTHGKEVQTIKLNG
ncbi:PTS glucose transporter subunit IIA [Lactobacillus sp. ESL0785]|uniref:PTS sugar transporter subunit IIA n=1 Tax=Lactobacillus sp. ESL0785 TaxID=2983232 RepID=UPI0023F9EB07|nr:PTS glucose transporter subunit IIA [Lactobacillus sp. ESL0785]WEV70783.1 PTS glucose transporter subunit IIA [Lactobacillus sp. ESL0785]